MHKVRTNRDVIACTGVQHVSDWNDGGAVSGPGAHVEFEAQFIEPLVTMLHDDQLEAAIWAANAGRGNDGKSKRGETVPNCTAAD